jgi:hypothetical protein
MDYAHAWTSAPVLKVWLHAHSCHLALALLVAISILYVRADQTLGGARHRYRAQNQALPTVQPADHRPKLDRKALERHEGLTKAESSLLTQARTGAIRLKDFVRDKWHLSETQSTANADSILLIES